MDWSDDADTVSWDSERDVDRLTMDQLRQLGREAVGAATNSLTRLMYGWTPAIDLKTIRDRMSRHAHGYSFVHDPANQLSTAYLDLSSRACLDRVDGLLTGERWNVEAVRRYLDEEVEFLTQLMLMMHLRGGQAPRTTELFSLEHRNGAGTSRGVYVHDGAVVYITRHAKARRITNQEFQVARYLPDRDSRMLAAYLVYVRPFTDMLYRVCLRRGPERRLLFATPSDARQPWTAETLTTALKKLTRAVCGVPFGVHVYRQISVAVTEKHVKQISRPFNRYDDHSVAADIEVAFSWQSGHRPIQRGVTYGIDAAFPDSLQPALLRIYRWASREWQRFLRADEGTPGPATDGDADGRDGDGLSTVELSTVGLSTVELSTVGLTPVELTTVECSGTSRKRRRDSVDSVTSDDLTVNEGSEHADPPPKRRALPPPTGEMAEMEGPPGAGSESPTMSPNISTAPPPPPSTNMISDVALAEMSRSRPRRVNQSSWRWVYSDRMDWGGPRHQIPHPHSDDGRDDDEVFWYHADSKVLICVQHAVGVQNLAVHLAERHSYSRARRRAIMQKYAAYERPPASQVALPVAGGPPIPALGRPLTAWRCDEDGCEVTSINETVIRHHCNRVHRWNSRPDDLSHWHQVTVQTFFQNAGARRYFVVRDERHGPGEEEPWEAEEC